MTTQSRKIFIDSSILISFIDRGNPNHLKASKAIGDLASIGYQLYTSSEVMIDSFALLSSEVGTAIALEFLQTMLQSNIEILFSQKTDLITAHRILRVNRERQITLDEALKATLMQKRGIVQILTFEYWNNLFGTYISNLLVV